LPVLHLDFNLKTAVVYRKGRKEIQLVMKIKRLTNQVKDISQITALFFLEFFAFLRFKCFL